MRHIDYMRAVMYYGRQLLPELRRQAIPPPSVWICWIDGNDWLLVGKSDSWVEKVTRRGAMASDLTNTQAYTVYKDFNHPINNTRQSLERNTNYFISCSEWAFLTAAHAEWIEGKLIASGQPNGVGAIYFVTENFYEQYTTIGD